MIIYKADHTYSTVTGRSKKSQPHSSSQKHTPSQQKAPEIKGKKMEKKHFGSTRSRSTFPTDIKIKHTDSSRLVEIKGRPPPRRCAETLAPRRPWRRVGATPPPHSKPSHGLQESGKNSQHRGEQCKHSQGSHSNDTVE